MRRYLEGNPKSLDAGLLLGRLVLEQGRNEEAVAVFESVIAAHPASTQPYYYLARAHHEAGRTESAVAVLERLVALQGERGDTADLAALGESLALHERLINDYEGRFHERWKTSLSRIHEAEGAQPREPAVEEQSALEGAAELVADTVPIISIGSLEPPLVVEEEEELLDLSATEEEQEEQTLQMDHVAPPTVVTLVAPQDRRPEPAPQPWPQPAPQQPPPQAWPQQQPQAWPVQPPAPQRQPAPAASPAAPVIVAAAPQAQPSEATIRQGQMLAEIQEELKGIRRALAARAQPVQVMVRQPEPAAAAAPAHKAEEDRARPPVPLQWSKTAALMEYLEGLARHLPDKPRKRFDASDIKLRMQYIRERLEGRSGLKQRVERRLLERPAAGREAVPDVKVTSSRLAGTLRFLRGLATLLPDREVKSSLDGKLDSVIVQLENGDS